MKLKKLGPVGPEEFSIVSTEYVSGSRLLRFGFKQLVLVFRRTFPFVGNDPSGGRRNSGIARSSPRFRSLVQNFFPFFHPRLKPGF